MERIIVIYKNNLFFPIHSIKFPEIPTNKTDSTDNVVRDIIFSFNIAPQQTQNHDHKKAFHH